MSYITITPDGAVKKITVKCNKYTPGVTQPGDITGNEIIQTITILLPQRNTTDRYTFSRYLSGMGIRGNADTPEINAVRSKFYDNGIPINIDVVPLTDTTNYYLLFCCRFGKNYWCLYGKGNGQQVQTYSCLTKHVKNVLSANEWLDFTSSGVFSSQPTFRRGIQYHDNPRITFVEYDYNGTNYIGMASSFMMETGDPQRPSGTTPYNVTLLSNALMKEAVYDIIGQPDEVPDNPFPPDSDPDGGGDYDPDPSEPTGEPDLPDIGITSCGLVNVYNPTTGELSGMGDDLFPSFTFPEPSTETGLEGIKENIFNLVESVKNGVKCLLNKGLIDYVIDCHIIPVSPTIGQKEFIKVGHKTLEQTSYRVTNDYVTVNCGAISVKQVYNNFIDYVGSKIKMYIPFVGFIDVNPNWCMGGSLGLKYHFNVIDGSFVAFLIANSNSRNGLSNTVVGSYGGNCSVHLPLTGTNYSSMISGIVASGTALASSVATGNVSDAIGSGLSMLSSTPSVASSNGYNSGMAFMSFRKPYIMVQRPVASFSGKYTKENGIPLNVSMKLSDVKGFTTCENVVFTNCNVTEEEQNLIREALKEGTIF